MSEYNQSRSFNLGIAREISIEAALVFDELNFWAGKGSRRDGWIYKSYGEMLERLPISEYQLRKAYKALDTKGLIEIKVMKVEGAPTLHFRILRNLRMENEETSESIETEETKDSIYTATNTATNTEKDFRDNDSLIDKEMDEKLFFDLVKELGFNPSLVKLSTERRKKLAARLKTYTQDDLIKAAKAIRSNDYMQGKNDGKVRYGTISYLIRNDEKVEQWLLQYKESDGQTLKERVAEQERKIKARMIDNA